MILQEDINNLIIKQALNVASTYIGTKETPPGSNRGVEVDKIQQAFNYIGVQYCALFAQYVYKIVCRINGRVSPLPGTASSQTLYEWAVKNKVNSTDWSKLQPGDIVIWRKRKLWQGHVGIVVEVNHAEEYFWTIEGNTSNSDLGSQRDGDGIYKRKRYMKKSDFVVDAFWLRGFISMRQTLSVATIK